MKSQAVINRPLRGELAMGAINDLLTKGFLTSRQTGAQDVQAQAIKTMEEQVSKGGQTTAAKVFGQDTFARAAAPKLTASVDPMLAIDTAEKQFEPAMLKQVPSAIGAPTDAVETQNLANLYQQTYTGATPLVDTSVDSLMAQGTIAQATQKAPEMNAPALETYVQGVMNRLTKAAGVEDYQVHLLDSSTVNAFNAGGPSMVVFKGILPFMKNEAELAGVLGHEMTHGIKRHVIDGVVTQDAAQSAGSLVAQQNPIARADMVQLKSILGQLTPAQQQNPDFVLQYLQGKVKPEVLTNLKFNEDNQFANLALSRAHETEADAGSARVLSKAGYDPNALITAFQRLPQATGDVRFLDHPTNQQRISDLQAEIKNENLAQGPMDLGADRYAQALAGLKTA
jgi:predicted Zn-dependent protease